jgi:hypothetical protein
MMRLASPGLVTVFVCSERCERMLPVVPERLMRGLMFPHIARMPEEATASE